MKPFSIFLAMSLLIAQNVQSQDSLSTLHTTDRKAPFARLTFIGEMSIKVHIMDIKDSSLFVHQRTSASPDPFHKTDIYKESNWDKYGYRYIKEVKVFNKKLRSWLIPVSLVGGMIAGGLIGYAVANEDVLNQTGGALLGALLGGGIGVVTGVLICNGSDKKYLINGEWKSFEEMKKNMNY